MLASSGDKIPPCGVPVQVSSRLPVVVMTPALRNALTIVKTFLSVIRARILSINAAWSMASKHDWISASSTHP